MKLLKFLKYSKKAAYMWSDSEDFAILADMYQLKIKIITVKDSMDKNPTVNRIHPDEKMKEFAELNNVELDEMVLLHQTDNHFNLIVSKDSDLAKYGSLSYRFNVGPTMDNEECIDTDNFYEVDDKDNFKENEESETLKKELSKQKESFKTLEIEYQKCIQELRRKTAEAEKLKSEVKDLREIGKLDEQLKENNVVNSSSKEDVKEEEILLKMKSSGARRTNPQSQSSPAKSVKDILKNIQNNNRNGQVDPQFNCKVCDFQGTKEEELRNHIIIKHTPQSNIDEMIKCRNCGIQFKRKKDLMNHRKREHFNSVAPCRNYRNKNCPFSAELCWWNHAENQEQKIECFICGESFENKSSMMSHRKSEHSSMVKLCNQSKEMNCRFEAKSCWFKHEEDENDTNTSSVFQSVSRKKEPPIHSQ